MDSSTVDSKHLSVEPLVFVKSRLPEPSPMQVKVWQKFKDFNETSTHFGSIQSTIDSMVQTRSLLKVDEDDVTVLNLPQGIKMESMIAIPYPNTLTFMAIALNHLLDGFPTEILQKPLKDIDTDIVLPNDLRHMTLLDMFNILPRHNKDQIGLVNEMNVIGRTAFLVINDLFQRYHKDGWHDVFLSLSLNNATMTDQQSIEAPLNDLAMFTRSVLNDLKVLNAPSIDKLPRITSSKGYVFSWWLNCERDGPCLTGVLPRDAMISFSPALRIYILPSVEIGFVISNSLQRTHNTRTLSELINYDAEIFTRMLRVVESQNDQQQQQQQQSSTGTKQDETSDSVIDSQSNQQQDKESVSTNDQTVVDDDSNETLDMIFETLKKYIVLCMEFTERQYLFVRSMMWLIFLLVAHLFTSWIYTGIWWVLCKLVKRTHEPRPKGAD